MSTNDLWPDFDSQAALRSPFSILNEAAQTLATKTNNLVTAELRKLNNISAAFGYTMVLAAPALGSYNYRMFDISYNIDMYPTSLVLDSRIGDELGISRDQSGKRRIQAQDEEELFSNLRAIFSSDR